MNELLDLIKERFALNEPLILVTITESAGSVPRGKGARMLVGKGDGSARRLWGSIGGGLTEHLAIEEAGRLLPEWKPPRAPVGTAGQDCAEKPILSRKYVLHSGEAADLGAANDGAASNGAVSNGVANDGAASNGAANDGAVCGGEITVSFRVIGPGEEGVIKEIEKEMASDGFVYIFGGGHIAQELVPLLARLDFRCVVFDDREEFSRPALFPGAEKAVSGDFNDIGKDIALGENDYAVIITRGHLWDLEAWAFALQSPARYIGVIGSKTKHDHVKRQLLERGFGPDQINAPRVHAPIGLAIKSETPAELAVSIASELILVRAELNSV